MNIYSQSTGYLFFTLAMGLFTNQSLAMECGAVASQTSVIDGNEYVLELIRDNGNVLSQKENYSTSDRNFTYLLAPGWHTLTALKWSKKDFSRLKESRRRMRLKNRAEDSELKNRENNDWDNRSGLLPNKLKQFKILVQAGSKVTVGLDNNGNENVKVLSTDAFICEKFEQPLIAGGGGDYLVNNADVILPKGLEYRLRKVMTNISTYHKDKQLQAENVIPVHIESNFGIILDNTYDTNKNAIKVLAVRPGSMASSAGLYSGDRITALGGKAINTNDDSPHVQFSQFIGSRSYDEKLNFKIIRDNKELKISNFIKVQLVPEVNYSFKGNESLATFVPRVNILKNDEHHLMEVTKEILNYYQKNGIQSDSIKLSRKDTDDYIYGISATVKQTAIGHNVAIEYVAEGSLAEKFGLLANDEIVAFNDINMTANGLTLLGALIAQLDSNESYNMLISRSGKNVKITNTYAPEILVSFDYTIDNYKVMKLSPQVANSQKVRGYEVFEDSVLYRQRFMNLRGRPPATGDSPNASYRHVTSSSSTTPTRNSSSPGSSSRTSTGSVGSKKSN